MAGESPVSRRSFVKLAGSGAVGLALAGCTGQDSDGAATEPDTSTKAPDTADGGDTDTGGDGGGDRAYTDNEFVLLMGNPHEVLDPHKDFVASLLLQQQFYDALLFIDPDTTAPIAHVATDWTIADQGRTWEFTLRDDIPFQNGGTLTADDVVYSMRRILALGQGPAQLWSGIVAPDAIQATGDHTVQISLGNPYAPLLGTFTQFRIVDSRTVEDNADDEWGESYLSENVAGSGPYRLIEWQRGGSMTGEAFHDYWGGWEANQFGTFRIEVVQEIATALAKMKAGEGDAYDQNLGINQKEDIQRQDNLTLFEAPNVRLFYGHMNTGKPPFDDPKVREAFHHVLDYETIQQNIFGAGLIAAGPVPRVLKKFHNENVPVSEQNVQAAKAALDASSYTAQEINQLDVVLWQTGDDPHRKITLLLQQNLQEHLGVEVSIEKHGFGSYIESAGSPESAPNQAFTYQPASVPGPDPFTYRMFHPDNLGNYDSMHHWSSQEVGQILDAARTAASEEESIARYKEAQQLIFDAHPMLFIMNPPVRRVINKNLGSFKHYGLFRFEFHPYHLTREGDGRAR